MEKIIVKNELKLALKQQINSLSRELQNEINELLRSPGFGELVGFSGKPMDMDEVQLSKVILLWLLKGSEDKRLDSKNVLEFDKYSTVIGYLANFKKKD